MAVASSSFLEAWRSFERRRRRLCVVLVVVILFDVAVVKKDAFWSLPEHLWWCDDDGNRKSDLIETTADLPPRVFDRAKIDDEEDDLTVLVGGREALVGVAATALRMIRLTSPVIQCVLICRIPILIKSYFFEALFFPFFFDFLFRFFSKYFLFFVVVRFCRNASFFFSLLLLLQFFLVVVVVVVVIVVVVVVVVSAR